MTRGDVKNLAASVRARLASLARERGEEFGQMLSRYARERLLYRLSVSDHSEQFILKGALLFSYWTGAPHRPTRDLDLLGRGEPDIRLLEQVFREICRAAVDADGLTFPEESVRGERIKDDEEYEGVRLHLVAMLARARIPVQVDVGFGDAVVPGPEEVEFPVLLDFPAPRLKAYARETSVAEKFEAMVKLGMLNTRMKDFYDLWELSRRFTFDGAILCRSIKATFERRGTTLPTDHPSALRPTFYENAEKIAQWNGFLRKGHIVVEGRSLAEVVGVLRAFLMPPASAAARDEDFSQVWKASGPWLPG
jgi:predicted nucleotidyltransferase component of viral defense system